MVETDFETDILKTCFCPFPWVQDFQNGKKPEMEVKISPIKTIKKGSARPKTRASMSKTSIEKSNAAAAKKETPMKIKGW